MTTVAHPISPRGQRARFDTVEELIEALAVPAFRILLDPPPGTATEADVIRLVDGDHKRLVELVDGTLVEKAMGKRESELAALLIIAIGSFVYPRKLGKVYGADLMARMSGRRNIRLPDVTYVAYADMPGGKYLDEVVLSSSMTLAIEVLSPSNTKKEMLQKREEYFASGAKLVWEFELKTRIVGVYSGPQTVTVLHANDVLDGEDVLPGFTLSVGELFAQVDERQS